MRKKLKRFKQNIERENVIQPGKKFFEQIKGNWRSIYFKNDNEIVLEVGCGRGEYTTGLAKIFPHKNFIGTDIKGVRIWVGSHLADRENLHNVVFLRIQVQSIEKFFEKNEVNEIWLTFPDPRPKLSDERRRLTCPRFLNLYKNILQSGGLIHLKTDNEMLFDYTLQVISNREDVRDIEYTRDLYKSDLLLEHYGIQTKYESEYQAQGLTIKYLRFRLD